jgi:hypothetical protein
MPFQTHRAPCRGFSPCRSRAGRDVTPDRSQWSSPIDRHLSGHPVRILIVPTCTSS